MKARRIGGLLGCPRHFFLFGALDRNSTAQMNRVTASLRPCVPMALSARMRVRVLGPRKARVVGTVHSMNSRHAFNELGACVLFGGLHTRVNGRRQELLVPLLPPSLSAAAQELWRGQAVPAQQPPAQEDPSAGEASLTLPACVLT